MSRLAGYLDLPNYSILQLARDKGKRVVGSVVWNRNKQESCWPQYQYTVQFTWRPLVLLVFLKSPSHLLHPSHNPTRPLFSASASLTVQHV